MQDIILNVTKDRGASIVRKQNIPIDSIRIVADHTTYRKVFYEANRVGDFHDIEVTDTLQGIITKADATGYAHALQILTVEKWKGTNKLMPQSRIMNLNRAFCAIYPVTDPTAPLAKAKILYKNYEDRIAFEVLVQEDLTQSETPAYYGS